MFTNRCSLTNYETALLQGSDCIKPFVAMQTCMAANPKAFVQYTGEDRKESSAPGESTEVEKRSVPVPASPPTGAIRNPIL